MNAEDYFVRIPDGHRRAMARPSDKTIDRNLRKMIEKREQKRGLHYKRRRWYLQAGTGRPGG